MNKIIKIISLFTILFLTFFKNVSANEKIKIGLLVPLSGENAQIGESIIKSTRLAINKINNPSVEIIPKDSGSNPDTTLKSAQEFSQLGIKIVIGPIFN